MKHEFDRNRKRVPLCPCKKTNADGKFSPFIGYDDKGYCYSCGEIFLPENDDTKYEIAQSFCKNSKKETSYIPLDIVEQSMKECECNNFTSWLEELFGKDIVNDLKKKYYIGSSQFWNRSTIFWYYDISCMCRSGKIMLYNTDGNRLKQPFDHCTWAHKVERLEDFEFNMCFFGEHLINNSDAPIAIVESEKTAIISSIYFPELIWIACSGANGLITSKSSSLEGRNVVLYPDLGKYDLWNEKAKHLQSICSSVKVSDFLERNVIDDDRKYGYDIADYLIHFPVTDFVKPLKIISCSNAESSKEEDEQNISIISEAFDNTNWDDDIWNVPVNNKSELEEIEAIEVYLSKLDLPKGLVRINRWKSTNDLAYCIERAIFNAKLTAGKQHTGHECLKRLRDIKIALCTYLPDK